MHAHHAVLTHQPLHRATGHWEAFPVQLQPHLARPVRAVVVVFVDPTDLLQQLRIPDDMGSVRDRSGGVFVVGGRGDPHTQVLGQHRADRLDSPPQTTRLPVVRVRTDELRDQWEGRSSSAAKKGLICG